jgi:hypothetical protein
MKFERSALKVEQLAHARPDARRDVCLGVIN